MYIFWESTQKARTEHFCDHCFNYIQPGDIYKRYAWVPQKGRFYILKQHSWPDCPPEMYAPVLEEEEVGCAVSYALAIRMKAVIRQLRNGDSETVYEPETVLVPITEPEPSVGLDYDDDIPF